MITIHKHKLPIHGPTSLQLHEGFCALSVGLQQDDVVLWVSCNNTKPEVSVQFYSAFTGEDLDHLFGLSLNFIGTVQNVDGLVTHVFME